MGAFLKAVLLVIVFCMSGNSYAFRVESVSNANLGSFSEIRCGAGITCNKSSGNKIEMDIVSDGSAGDVLAGFRVNTISVSTAKTATQAECGSTYIGLADVSITLPDSGAVFGCTYRVINGNDASSVYLNPQATDNLEYITNNVGDGILSTTLGDSVTVMAVSIDQWAVIAISSLTNWVDADEN